MTKSYEEQLENRIEELEEEIRGFDKICDRYESIKSYIMEKYDCDMDGQAWHNLLMEFIEDEEVSDFIQKKKAEEQNKSDTFLSNKVSLPNFTMSIESTPVMWSDPINNLVDIKCDTLHIKDATLEEHEIITLKDIVKSWKKEGPFSKFWKKIKRCWTKKTNT